MNAALKEVYVRPKDGDFELLRPGHRRGLLFDSQDLAIEHARDMAPLVLVLNRSGQVERELRERDDLRALVAEHYAGLALEVRQPSDGCWSVVERWRDGEHVGWFVEHEGRCFGGLGADCGEDGPYPTREAALSCMAMHLRSAIAESQARC